MTAPSPQGLLMFLRNLGSLLTVIALLLPAFLFISDSEKLREVIADLSGVSDLSAQIAALDAKIGSNTGDLRNIEIRFAATEDTLAALRAGRGSDQPAALFARDGHNVGTGPPGGRVRMEWVLRQFRDCGPPELAVRFRNGDSIVHNFRALSITDAQGRADELEAAPYREQSLIFTGLIPDDEDVRPGQAAAWAVMTFPNCPHAPTARSPEVGFAISQRDRT